jgi:hypothetical protein
MKAADWNAAVAVGAAVEITLDSGDLLQTCTRSEAWDLDSGHTLVSVEGVAGGYRIERVRPIQQPLVAPPPTMKWYRVSVARDINHGRKEGRAWEFEALDEWEAYTMFDNARRAAVRNLRGFKLLKIERLDPKTRQPVSTYEGAEFMAPRPVAQSVRTIIIESEPK